jgi:hypothetical protein
MNKFIQISSFYLFLFVLLFQSCKTDEFKFNEITIKEDFETDVILPLFTGKGMEFRDFVFDWKEKIPASSGPFTVLDYINFPDKTIPTQLIFDPSLVIDGLDYFLQDNYSFKQIELMFTVANGCPFPLNLQVQFVDSIGLNSTVPPVTPPAFPEADFTQTPVKQITTVHIMKLDSLQTQNFNDSKFIKLTSWYNQTNFINQNDTLSAHYPIDLTIVLIGVGQPRNEKTTP